MTLAKGFQLHVIAQITLAFIGSLTAY